MTSSDINLDPDEAARAGHLLSLAAEQILRVRNTTGQRIDDLTQGAPWGSDLLGAAFAQNYTDPAAQILDVWRKAADRTAQLGADVVDATTTTVATDNADRLSRQGAFPSVARL